MRLRREHNERAWLAYHTAGLPRQKTFPKLDRLLVSPDGRPRRQTWQDHMAIMGRWAAVMRRAEAHKQRKKAVN